MIWFLPLYLLGGVLAGFVVAAVLMALAFGTIWVLDKLEDMLGDLAVPFFIFGFLGALGGVIAWTSR
jgi:hypothetical protein